jgi:SOS-response transcriptional repressor LexA
VELPDGRKWEFRFVKVACNVAMPVGTEENQLPALLREWFGPRAGVPGTNATVEFTPSQGNEIWLVKPVMPAAAAVSAPVEAPVGAPAGMVAERPADPEGWVPVYELAAAAGAFSEEQVPEPMGWLRPLDRKVRPADFLAQVRGHSMEPTIPDGSWCLFRSNVVGSRNGRVLLVQHRSITDPEHGGRFTVKRYRSEKVAAQDSWEHASVALVPDNPAYGTIDIDPQQSRDLRIIAEFIDLLKDS